MKGALALLWFVSVAVAFVVGRVAVFGDASPAPDTVASFREALATRDELARAWRMSAFLQAMGPAELPAAVDALEENNVGVTREEVRLFMLAWSRFDAPGAFAWARAWPTQWTDTLTDEAIYAWGFRDAPAALRALDAVGDAELQARLRSSLLGGWLHGPDRKGASEYIAAISDPRQRRRLAFLLAAETMRDGPEAVIAWADAVPEDAPNDFKRGAFYHATLMLAGADPRQAAAWFETHRARPYSAGSLDAIARRWAEREDPQALFAWLRGLPSDGERAGEPGEAIAVGFRVWLRKAPEQAEAWLGSQPPAAGLDPALGELVRARTQADPASAVEWAGRIQDETLRRKSLVLAGRAWEGKDPEAARAWLARSDLPEDLREAIQSTGAVAGRRSGALPVSPPARR